MNYQSPSGFERAPAEDAECARLRALPLYRRAARGLQRLDSLVARIARQAGWPVCVVSLIEAEDQVVIGSVGVDHFVVPREESICTDTIARPDEVLHVADLTCDPRFSAKPVVAGEPGVRAYAGAAIRAPNGVALGAICLADFTPHGLDPASRVLLTEAAAAISVALEQERLGQTRDAAVQILEAMQSAIILTDMDGIISYWNAGAESLFGHHRDDTVGRSVDLIIPEHFRASHEAGMARLKAGGESRLVGKAVEVNARHADGREVPIELRLAMCPGEGGMQMCAVAHDITARRHREIELQKMAEHDTLTGCKNPANFRRLLAERLEAADGPSALFLLDLDGFKQVNDNLGHQIGDALLQAVSLRLAKLSEPGTVVGRLGGDEFGVLFPGLDREAAGAWAEALIAAICEVFIIDDHRIHVSTSVGGCCVEQATGDVERVVANADTALLAAKAGGGQQAVFYDGKLARRDEARRAFRDELRAAHKAIQWHIDYQPQVDLRDGSLIGLEALLRWKHPRLGLLQPSAFMAILESHLVAADVGLWVIAESCRQLARWREEGHRIPRMAVNLFASQLEDDELPFLIGDILMRNGLAPDDLELEITEKIALANGGRTMRTVHQLAAMGVNIALDDFGTGHASLSTFATIVPSRLKIDRSFIREIVDSPQQRAVVKGLLAIAGGLGSEVIAEGIEDRAQADVLLGLGCTLGQGFLYGRTYAPGPAD